MKSPVNAGQRGLCSALHVRHNIGFADHLDLHILQALVAKDGLTLYGSLADGTLLIRSAVIPCVLSLIKTPCDAKLKELCAEWQRFSDVLELAGWRQIKWLSLQRDPGLWL